MLSKDSLKFKFGYNFSLPVLFAIACVSFIGQSLFLFQVLSMGKGRSNDKFFLLDMFIRRILNERCNQIS